MAEIIYWQSDNVLEVTGLQNAVSDAYLNSATVKVTIVDESTSPAGGETWPLSLQYVTDSNGNYRATLADTLGLDRERRYTARITADGGAGLKRTWYVPLVCKVGES